MLDALNNLLVFGNNLRNSLILCLTESGAKLLPVCTTYPEKVVLYRKADTCFNERVFRRKYAFFLNLLFSVIAMIAERPY